MKQKFVADQRVQFKNTPFTKAVYWTVIVPEPDEVGHVVLHSPRTNEYAVVYQIDLKAL